MKACLHVPRRCLQPVIEEQPQLPALLCEKCAAATLRTGFARLHKKHVSNIYVD